MEAGGMAVAKDIDPSKLSFKGAPVFDPTPFYDDELKKAYLDPASLRLDSVVGVPPPVRVRGSSDAAMELYRTLDSTGRLSLIDPARVTDNPKAGLFAVAKDASKDRLIKDDRPPNFFEKQLKRWSKLLAASSSFLGIYIPAGCVLAVYGLDLSD